LSIINSDFYCQIERIMRFYGSQLIAVFRSAELRCYLGAASF